MEHLPSVTPLKEVMEQTRMTPQEVLGKINQGFDRQELSGDVHDMSDATRYVLAVMGIDPVLQSFKNKDNDNNDASKDESNPTQGIEDTSLITAMQQQLQQLPPGLDSTRFKVEVVAAQTDTELGTPEGDAEIIQAIKEKANQDNENAKKRSVGSEHAQSPAEAIAKILERGAPDIPAGKTAIEALSLAPTIDEKVPTYWEIIPFRRAEKRAKEIPFTRGQKVKGFIKGKIHASFDARYQIDNLIAQWNKEEQQIVQDAVNNGPDDQERFVFAMPDEHGVWRKYDGSPLSPSEVHIAKRSQKNAHLNVARYQGLAAYEIGKIEEPEQAESAWNHILNVMYQQLHYNEPQIKGVMIGLQFMKKSTYLTFKHRDIIHPVIGQRDTGKVDSEGRAIFEPIQDKTRLIFGELKAVPYITELVDKFRAPYDFAFATADVAEIGKLLRKTAARADQNYYDPEKRTEQQHKEDMYVLAGLYNVAQMTRMEASGLDPSKPEEVDQFRRYQGAPQYEPKIAGSTSANNLWKKMVKEIEEVAKRYPQLKVNSLDFNNFPSFSEYDADLNDPSIPDMRRRTAAHH